jgi:hypothetical protein
MTRLTSRATLGALLTAVAACQTLSSAGWADTRAPNESLVGTWTVEFRLDSVIGSGTTSRRWQAASFRAIRGQLRLTDSTTRSAGIVRSSIDLDFTPLLGRQMSCFEPRPTETWVERQGDTVRFRFTPNAADCGVGASGVLRGDSLIGSWDETSFVGPVAMGRFSMTRPGR